ncbi:MAG: sulfite exporter TauE/SafE family protein [Bacteroidaceae bacterium]|nr:sulfite exporter TauE/SafE family protein [Bacteroidaceae bacterium]
MEWLQSVLDNGTTPALTAFVLGLLTAISPCPLATNIAAIGFIAKHIEDRKAIFIRGLCYTAGRVVAYTVLGIILISVLKGGASMFGIQKAVSKWGESLLGPLLLVIGLFMLFGHRLNLPKSGTGGGERGERLAGKGSRGAWLLGVLFALAFCPSSGMLYFGMLIPMSVTASAGWLLPVLFAVATSLPVLVVAWILAFSVLHIGVFYGQMQKVQYGLNLVVGILFLVVGIYYCCVMYLDYFL